MCINIITERQNKFFTEVKPHMDLLTLSFTFNLASCEIKIWAIFNQPLLEA